jgi:CTP:molybdopterin cytidylyltransferase MocA
VSRVAAVVLAAGEASRFGAPKQALLLPEVLDRLDESPVDEVVVVTGAYRLDVAAEAARRLPVRIVHCPAWALGPGASLRCGLAALGPGTEAAVVVLADGPELAPEAVARVLAAWRETGGGIVAASYAGRRGHPLVLAAAAREEVPDEGLRDRAVRLVPCDDLGSPGDVDTPADVPGRLR